MDELDGIRVGFESESNRTMLNAYFNIQFDRHLQLRMGKPVMG